MLLEEFKYAVKKIKNAINEELHECDEESYDESDKSDEDWGCILMVF